MESLNRPIRSADGLSLHLRHWQAVPLAQAVRDSIGEFALAYASGEPQALMGEFMARKAAHRAKA